MRSVVYDTCLITKANGNTLGRKGNNVLDRRLKEIEAFVKKQVVARYNPKLRSEYEEHIFKPGARNDIIVAFITALAESGEFVTTSTVPKKQWIKLDGAWPGHDKHLLAAALGGSNPKVVTTESVLGNAHAKVKRILKISVECI